VDLILYLVFIASATEDKDQLKEMKKLEGIWEVVGMEMKGKALPAKDRPIQKVIFRDNKKAAQKEAKESQVYTYTLDPSKEPKTMEATEVGAKKKSTLVGIYQVDKDTLKLCLDLDGKGLPKEFKTNAQSEVILLELKRKKE
jgi:uncharacterized protein (TIGR03067 family)